MPDDENSLVSLGNLKGKIIVLYFYPKDNTPGCIREACDFRDLKKEFEKTNTVILGISNDSVRSHQKFKEKYRLTFPLLFDSDKKVARTYGVYQRKTLYGKSFFGIVRTTLVVDRNGRIAKIFPAVKVAGHAREGLAVVRTLK